ncbi:MAG: T6SS immunity protein Tdi1 domain-containing protein [Capsulimonas sp.]|uniref:T6SS immunity protein Tdi1 domain-containing protein n=1 Tax=Capsulimonas sp. TaxID=2494211 RepID=UPI0032668B84
MVNISGHDFKRFFSAYKYDGEIHLSENQTSPTLKSSRTLPLSYQSFLAQLRGHSFNNGMLRILNSTTTPSIEGWNSHSGWHSTWPKLAQRFYVFGYDWMGNQFALDFDRIDGVTGEPLITVVISGTGELLKAPVIFQKFMNTDLVDQSDFIIGSSYYKEWLESGGAIPQFNQCIGYKHPLSLGGIDDIDNLEISDLDVYIHLMGQMSAMG